MMKQIAEKRYNWRMAKEETIFKYESVDGFVFNSESQCMEHEEKVNYHMDFYRFCLTKGIYTKERLVEIYEDYERHREEWEQCGGKQWQNFCAGQYALEEVLGYSH